MGVERKGQLSAFFEDLYLDSSPENNWFVDFQKRLLLEHSTKKSLVLEIGTANGHFLESIHRQIRKGFGIDINENLLERAKVFNQSCNLEFKIGNACDIPYTDNLFDLVFCYSVLCISGDFSKVFHEMKRVCSQEGKMIFDVSNRRSFNFLKWSSFYRKSGLEYHALDRAELEQHVSSLQPTSFEIIGIGLITQFKYFPLLCRLDRLLDSNFVGFLDKFVSNVLFLRNFPARFLVIAKI
jgi:SAM-dependent methyltransferase